MNIGLTGIAQINSAGTVGAAGKPVRVFDVAGGTTEKAAVCTLFNGTNPTGLAPYITVLSSDSMHSNVGYRFPDGLFVIASGGTATINYITEF